MFTILVVEDNSDMRELFCTVLSDSGYRCLSASDGLEALEVMDREYVDLIVADIMMSGMDGYEMTRALREAKMDLPVLMVTAKDQFDDLKKGFRSGADDYMVKPINVKELVLRVEALLRRAKIQSEKRIVVGNTVLDYDALTVTIHGEETTLPQKEFYLLYKLLSYPNKIFTRPQLMDEIWGMFSETDERIAEIREMSQRFNAMAFDLSHIETLRSDFVVNVSHEFKTPIAAIEGYAMLLQNPALSGERHGHYVEKILDNSRKLSSLSSNILMLSKLENRQTVPQYNEYRLDEQIRKAILRLENRWSDKQLELDIDLPLQMYYGCESLLEQYSGQCREACAVRQHDSGEPAEKRKGYRGAHFRSG